MNYSKDSNEQRRKKSKALGKKATNLFGTILMRVIMLTVIVGVFAGVGAGIGIFLGMTSSAVEIQAVDVVPDARTTIIYEDKTGKEIDRLHGEENRIYVKIDKIPKYLQDAFVAIEDERFYEHSGVDVRAMLRSVYANIKSNSLSEGGSTITQQVIKNNILKDFSKNFKRKIQEQYLAVKYEQMLTEQLGSKEAAKAYILELYLNSIGLNRGLNGVQAAANYFYDKDVTELTLAQCAVIAAITQYPTKHDPLSHPENNQPRQKTILVKMLEHKMITQQEYDQAIAEDAYSVIKDVSHQKVEVASKHSYFVDQAVTQLASDIIIQKGVTKEQAYDLIYSGGLQVYLTVDMEMQKIVDEVYKDDSFFPPDAYEIKVEYNVTIKTPGSTSESHFYKTKTVKNEEQVEEYLNSLRIDFTADGSKIIKENVERIPQPQSSIVIIDYHNGQVKAFAGGRGEKPSVGRTFNRATQAYRQPGSTFKVLAAYAPAIDMGKLTASSMIMDEPYSVPIGSSQYSPKNWYTGYRGLSTVRQGVYDSMNVLAVRTLMEYVGIDTAFDYLKNFGFSSLVERKVSASGAVHTDMTPSLALGGITDGVSPLEVTAAYGTIANLGEYNKPVFYTRVLDYKGDTFLDTTPEQHKVLKPSTAYILTDMMKDTVTKGTGKAARFDEITMPQAGKTGTTTDVIDLVFAGYTPYYAATVWIGHDIPKEIKNNGVYYHALIWKHVMQEIHRELPMRDFAEPENLNRISICSVSGKLWSNTLCSKDSTATVITDFFSPGTSPTEICQGHEIVQICNESLGLFSPYCPTEAVKNVTIPAGLTVSQLVEYHIPTVPCQIHQMPVVTETTTEVTTNDWDNVIIIPPETEEQVTEQTTEATTEETTEEDNASIDNFDFQQGD